MAEGLFTKLRAFEGNSENPLIKIDILTLRKWMLYKNLPCAVQLLTFIFSMCLGGTLEHCKENTTKPRRIPSIEPNLFVYQFMPKIATLDRNKKLYWDS